MQVLKLLMVTRFTTPLGRMVAETVNLILSLRASTISLTKIAFVPVVDCIPAMQQREPTIFCGGEYGLFWWTRRRSAISASLLETVFITNPAPVKKSATLNLLLVTVTPRYKILQPSIPGIQAQLPRINLRLSVQQKGKANVFVQIYDPFSSMP